MTIQTRRKATQIKPPLQHCPAPTIVTHKPVKTCVRVQRQHWEGNRAYKPLSNCFYGGAFPHCLTGPCKRTFKQSGCPGTFSQSWGKRESSRYLSVCEL